MLFWLKHMYLMLGRKLRGFDLLAKFPANLIQYPENKGISLGLPGRGGGPH